MAKIKNNGKSDYLGMIINESFLQGQLELYKIEFSNTGNTKYLEVMNQFDATLKCFRHMKEIINKLSIENKELEKG
tara:strand:+ start:3814 stop:4041 length:228 start_codon:yes stop_codon:yes gene_type:complete